MIHVLGPFQSHMNPTAWRQSSPPTISAPLLTRSLAPALAAGNTCVMKASSYTPTTTAIMAEIFHEAGFPAGSVNVIHGLGSTVGKAMASHRDVDVIGFTGSEQTGRELMKISSQSQVIKKVYPRAGRQRRCHRDAGCGPGHCYGLPG